MSKHRTGSKALIREINEALVLDVVRAHGPVSRAEITSRTGLSAATVTGISGTLMGIGFLVEVDIVRGTGGRPAHLLDLRRDGVLVAGLQISPTEVTVALVNLRGEVVTSGRRALRSTRPESVARESAAALGRLVDGWPATSVLGVGVALSGVVDQTGGRVRHSGAMGWQDVPFQTLLAARVEVPILLDSYANAMAMDLLLYDASLDGRDLLVLSLGMSLGASVVVGGLVHRGFRGSAGGFAHSLVADAGAEVRPCHCGSENCLETWSSQWGIEQELARRGVADAGLGGPEAQPVLDEAARRLGVAMANVSKLVGPERVVLTTSPEMSAAPFVDGVQAEFEAQYLRENVPRPEVRWKTVERTGLARGAAYALLAQLFTTGAEASARPPVS